MDPSVIAIGIGAFAIICCICIIIVTVIMMLTGNKTPPANMPKAENPMSGSPQSGSPQPQIQQPYLVKGPGVFNPYDVSPAALNPANPGQNVTVPVLTAVVNGLAVAKDPNDIPAVTQALEATGTRILAEGQTTTNTNQAKELERAKELPGETVDCKGMYEAYTVRAICSAIQCGTGIETLVAKRKANAPTSCEPESIQNIDCINKQAPRCWYKTKINLCKTKGKHVIRYTSTNSKLDIPEPIEMSELVPPTEKTMTGDVDDTSKTCSASEMLTCGTYAQEWDRSTCLNRGNGDLGTKTKMYSGGKKLDDGTIPEYCIPNGIAITENCTEQDLTVGCEYDITSAAKTFCTVVGQQIAVNKSSGPAYCAKKVHVCTQNDYDNSDYKAKLDADNAKKTAQEANCKSTCDFQSSAYKCDAIGKQVDTTYIGNDATCPKTQPMICTEAHKAIYDQNCKYDTNAAYNACNTSGQISASRTASSNPNCPPTEPYNCPNWYWAECKTGNMFASNSTQSIVDICNQSFSGVQGYWGKDKDFPGGEYESLLD